MGGVLKRDFSAYRTSERHCTHPVISIDRSNRKTHEKWPFPLPPSGLSELVSCEQSEVSTGAVSGVCEGACEAPRDLHRMVHDNGANLPSGGDLILKAVDACDGGCRGAVPVEGRRDGAKNIKT